MRPLPPGVIIVVVAALSALAGAVLTWLILYAVGSTPRDAEQDRSQHPESRTDDVLRVVRTRAGHVVLVHGEKKAHLREIEDRETGEEVVAAVRAILAFAEGWLPALRQRQGSSAAATTPQRASGSGVSSSASPVSVSAGTENTSASSSPSELLNLFEQIDALLQKRASERPELAKRGIRLSEDTDGRLLIYVGRDHYRSTEDIPDDEVRAFIRETIRMWENQ